MWSTELVDSAIQNILEKSKHDTDFRKLCSTNPNEAIAKITGKEIPDNFKIKFIAPEEWDMAIILPPFEPQNDEICETELCAVSGGSKKGAQRFGEGLASGLSLGMYKGGSGKEGSVGRMIGNTIATKVISSAGISSDNATSAVEIASNIATKVNSK